MCGTQSHYDILRKHSPLNNSKQYAFASYAIIIIYIYNPFTLFLDSIPAPSLSPVQSVTGKCYNGHIIFAVDVPCKFEILPGGNFARSDGYGDIIRSGISHFSTFWKYACSLLSSSGYCAKVYYTNICSLQFDFEFLIIRDLNTLAEVCT